MNKEKQEAFRQINSIQNLNLRSLARGKPLQETSKRNLFLNYEPQLERFPLCGCFLCESSNDDYYKTRVKKLVIEPPRKVSQYNENGFVFIMKNLHSSKNLQRPLNINVMDSFIFENNEIKMLIHNTKYRLEIIKNKDKLEHRELKCLVRKQDDNIAKQQVIIQFTDGKYQLLTEMELNNIIYQRKSMEFLKQIQCIQQLVEQEQFSIVKYSFDIHQNYDLNLFMRAQYEIQNVHNQKVIYGMFTTSQELKFVNDLQQSNQQDYLLYTCYKIYHFLYMYQKTILKQADYEFMQDIEGKYFLVNCTYVNYEIMQIGIQVHVPSEKEIQELKRNVPVVTDKEPQRIKNEGIKSIVSEAIKHKLSTMDIREYHEKTILKTYDTLSQQVFQIAYPDSEILLNDILKLNFQSLMELVENDFISLVKKKQHDKIPQFFSSSKYRGHLDFTLDSDFDIMVQKVKNSLKTQPSQLPRLQNISKNIQQSIKIIPIKKDKYQKTPYYEPFLQDGSRYNFVYTNNKKIEKIQIKSDTFHSLRKMFHHIET